MESGVFICIIATFLQKATGQFFGIYKNFRMFFVHFYCTRTLKQRTPEKNRGSPVGWGIIDPIRFTSLTAGYDAMGLPRLTFHKTIFALHSSMNSHIIKSKVLKMQIIQ